MNGMTILAFFRLVQIDTFTALTNNESLINYTIFWRRRNKWKDAIMDENMFSKARYKHWFMNCSLWKNAKFCKTTLKQNSRFSLGHPAATGGHHANMFANSLQKWEFEPSPHCKKRTYSKISLFCWKTYSKNKFDQK